MDTNRFKRRDYALPARKPAPILDEFGELRQAPIDTPAEQPKVITVEQVSEPTPVQSAPEPLKPVYEKPVVDEGSTINLNEPNTGGWLDSLAPEGAMKAQQATTESLEAAEAVQAVPAQTISVQISLPTKISLPKPTIPELPDLPYRKIAVRAGLALGAAVLLTIGVLIAMHFLKKPPEAALTQAQRLSASLTKPTFTPVAPKDKAGLAASQAGSTSFDGKRNTYSYQDALNGVPLIVSQQPIPAKYNTPEDAVKTVAKNLGAKTTFKTAKGLVYEATSTKSSSQTLVLSVNDLLVFIQSNFLHDTTDWTDYVNALK